MEGPRQERNEVGGDLAGGHIYKAGGDIAAGDMYKVHEVLPSGLRQLIVDHKSSLEQGETDKLEAFIDELNHFTKPAGADGIQGLTWKLQQGGMEAHIERAIRLKELFNKMLHRDLLTTAAQKLFSYILALVELRFRQKISPLVGTMSPEELEAVTLAEVIEPIRIELNVEGYPLSPHIIEGMLFFLGGNCYVRWHQ